MSTASASSSSNSSYIAETSIVPVARAAKGSNESAPGFFSAYEAAYKLNDEKGQEQAQKKMSASFGDDDEAAEGKQWPEIFQLLSKYSFKELMRLSICKDESKLAKIIRAGRSSRGISQKVPVSATHSGQKAFVNQMTEQYMSTGRVMKVNAGRSYSGMM